MVVNKLKVIDLKLDLDENEIVLWSLSLALGLVEVCALQGCEDGPKIPKSKMGIIIKELKAMFPAADGKQIADLVKSCVV